MDESKTRSWDRHTRLLCAASCSDVCSRAHSRASTASQQRLAQASVRSSRAVQRTSVFWKQLAAACLLSAVSAASAQAQAGAPAPAPVAAPAPVDAPPAPPPPPPPPPPPAPVVAVPPAAPPPPPPVAPPPAPAPAWSPVYTGSFFTRYELRQGFDNAGVQRGRFIDGDAFFYRARFGFSTGAIDLGKDIKVGLQFTPQAAGVFGSLASTIADASLGLHEGYLRAGGKYVRVDAGRFELNYGDALVLGNLDWNEVARSFDGVRSRFSKSPTSAWVDVFATVIKEGRQQPVPLVKAGDGDQYLLGAYAALGPAIKAGLDLDIYLLSQIWAESQRSGTTSGTYRREGAAQFTIGARAKQKIKAFDYRFEGGIQAGKRGADLATIPAMPTPMTVTLVKATDVLAYQADLELGIALVRGKAPPAGAPPAAPGTPPPPDRFRVSLEGMYASGNDAKSNNKNEGWDELYPTAHKFLGLTDAFVLGGQKRTNVASGVLHLTAIPVTNFTLQADGHLFARVEDIAGAAPPATMPPMMALQKKGYAGSEVDIGAVYQIAKGLKARALYGVFMPSSDFYPTAATTVASGRGKDADPVHYLEVELRYDL
jgi:hypothetical protein